MPELCAAYRVDANGDGNDLALDDALVGLLLRDDDHPIMLMELFLQYGVEWDMSETHSRI